MSTSTSSTTTIDGHRGRLLLRSWSNEQLTFVALLVHGLGEHTGRYEHVAARLVRDGAVVYAPDHWGHGESAGEPGLVDDIDALAADLALVAERARAQHPGLPVVLIGHSLGGMIATRYAQQRPGELAALVLSGPVVGGNAAILGLLDLDELPAVPIDPAVLSRDPDVGRAYAEDPLVYHGPLQRGTLEAVRDSVATIAAGGGLGDLPTLWIHGEEDALAPYAETRPACERIGGSALEQKMYPGARHEIFNETNRDEVLDDVSQFLHRVLTKQG